MKNLNYENDPLLSNKNKIINGNLNIYGALIRKEDMLNNKKGVVLKKCPYILDESKDISKIMLKLKKDDLFKLRENLSEYLKIRRIRNDSLKNWIKKRVYPLYLLRIICILNNLDVNEIIKNKTITNFCRGSKIKMPSIVKTIKSDFMAYFLGLHMGDGTLNEERWKIVDGDRDEENLKYSLEFLKQINKKITKIFSISHSKIYKIKGKNAYELIIVNKWLGRYLNFMYGLEQKEKETFSIPMMLKGKEELILRGLFDTDGSIKNYRVSIGTKYDLLYREILKILNKQNIKYKVKKNDIKRENTVLIVEIHKDFIKKFIKKIGFSHPRKIKEIKSYLLTNSLSRNFKGYKGIYTPKIPEENFLELCQYIRPIKNAGKTRFISQFNKLDEGKKDELINNFKKNFRTSKSPNSKNYVYSYKIERVLTNHCIYERIRNRSEDVEILRTINKLKDIWN